MDLFMEMVSEAKQGLIKAESIKAAYQSESWCITVLDCTLRGKKLDYASKQAKT